MENELLECFDNLELIRKYLVKKGQSRFCGNVIKNKIAESEAIYNKCNQIFQYLSEKKGLKSEYLTSISLLKNKIKACYLQISDLCLVEKQDSDSRSDFCETSSHQIPIMEFDLKTACGFIPVMNSNENNTKTIIDCVEMYSEMLSESGKKLLIQFVLKSRLSENAKLRMSQEYTSTNELIKDLRNILLPKKSFTAIQSRLNNITQGWRTVDQFGTEIEKLFTNLTISQANDNSNNYAVLKPLNEKFAIKKFSDGLRNSRLSTIIAARNYDNLKDAIQAAKDEELAAASTSTSGENVMYTQRRGKYNHFYQTQTVRGYEQPRGQRGRGNNFRGRNFRGNNFRGNNYRGNNNVRGNSYNYYRGNRRDAYNSPTQSSSFRSRNETHGSGNNRVLCTDQTEQNQLVNEKSNDLQFFRVE